MQYIISDIDGNGTDYRRSFNNFGLTKESLITIRINFNFTLTYMEKRFSLNCYGSGRKNSPDSLK